MHGSGVVYIYMFGTNGLYNKVNNDEKLYLKIVQEIDDYVALCIYTPVLDPQAKSRASLTPVLVSSSGSGSRNGARSCIPPF